jgi:hypothetical protein
MTNVALTAAIHSSTASLLRRVFVGYGIVGVSMPTPSINDIKSSFSFLLGFFFPFIAARVLSHVEPMLHQSFTIVEALAGGSGGSDGAEEEVGRAQRQRNKIKELFFLIVDFEGAATRRRRFAGDRRVRQGR